MNSQRDIAVARGFAWGTPVDDVKREMALNGSEFGAGLRMSGGFAVPSMVSSVAANPIVQELAKDLLKQGATKLPGLAVKGVKKLSRWFKKLFGRGMDVPGGSIINPEDFSATLSPAQMVKYRRRVNKIKTDFVDENGNPLNIEGGFAFAPFLAPLAAPLISGLMGKIFGKGRLESKFQDPDFVKRWKRAQRRPHKMMNLLTRDFRQGKKKVSNSS